MPYFNHWLPLDDVAEVIASIPFSIFTEQRALINPIASLEGPLPHLAVLIRPEATISVILGVA